MTRHGETPFHARTAAEALEALRVDRDEGLSGDEASARRTKHGPNRLREAKARSAWSILFDQFKSMVLAVLAIAAGVAFAFQRLAEGAAISAVLLINVLIGFFSEWRAVRSMEALRKMGEQKTRVLRGGSQKVLPVEELVPGDVVLLEGGDVAPADLRLLEANNMRVKEAVLTGESVPVNKALEPVDADTPLAERQNMLYKGTTIAEGSGRAVVVATGMDTEIGHISRMTEEAEDEQTPLEKRLNDLGRRLAWITIAVAIVVGVVGVIAGQDTMLMIETAIALGVAAIPEGLPIVATIALARGMWLMARRNALVNRLTAVETLGATRVIFTDKTGTLTENQMTLRRIVTVSGDYRIRAGDGEPVLVRAEGTEGTGSSLESEPLVRRAFEIGALCNNAALPAQGDVEEEAGAEQLGDPTEAALLKGASLFGISRDALLEQKPEEREVPFDSALMMMATYHKADGGLYVAVKGAPQAVLEKCTRVAGEEGDDELNEDGRAEWLERSETLAAAGLRLLALADRTAPNADTEPYEDLRLVALVALLDPPRKGVKDSIRACRDAGIRVVMVTGDKSATATAIARELGLIDSSEDTVVEGKDLPPSDEMSDEQRDRVLKTRVFARFSPEQKLDLVRVFQDSDETIAMTGDGVNDAPALKKADIGVAMGKRGTDAAREAADMVLKDDAFSSIVAAVEQGRVIFRNIRKSVMFMLCTNVAEVIAVAAASLFGIPIPLRPLQILYLNVLTDVFPALALGVGKGAPDIMGRPPRPHGEPVITRRHWLIVGGWSVFISACVLGALLLALYWLDLGELEAVTVSFLTLAFGKLLFVFNLRDRGSRLASNDIVRNPWVWGSIALCAGLLLLAVYLPGLSGLLQTRPPGPWGWAIVAAGAVLPFVAGQIIRAVQKPPGTSG